MDKPGGPSSGPHWRHRVLGTRLNALPAFVSLRQTQAPAVLDHVGALPQRDWDAGPAFAGRAEGSEGNLVIFDVGDVLHDAFAVGRPGVNAEHQTLTNVGSGS